jgi:hypothetical protein
MKCVNGHENTDAARFCGTCGQGMASSAGGPSGFSGSVGAGHYQSPGISVQTLKIGLVNDLKAHRHSGYPTTLQSILGMVSGALFAAAIFYLSVDAVDSSGSDSPYAGGVFWSALGCVGLYLLVKFVSSDLIVGATTAFVPLAAFLSLFLFGTSIEDGKIGLALFLLGIGYAAAWALPVLRGRPSLLTSALLTSGFGLIVLMVQSSIIRIVNCSSSYDSGYSGYSDSGCFQDPTELLRVVAQQSATLLLLLGIGLLAVAWTLDRKDWPVLGKVFIGVGIVFEVSGAFGVLNSGDDTTAASILMTIAGVLLVLVAIQRSRKTSLIIGGVGAFIGIIAFIDALTASNENPVVFILLSLLASAGLGFLCLKKSTVIQNRIQSIGKP